MIGSGGLLAQAPALASATGLAPALVTALNLGLVVLAIITILLVVLLIGLMRLKKGLAAEVRQLLAENQLDAQQVARDTQEVRRDITQLEALVREEMARSREELHRVLRENREEIGRSFATLGSGTNQNLAEIARYQKEQLAAFQLALTDSIQQFNAMQDQKFSQLIAKQAELTQSTEQRLTAIGQTVDQKLQESVEKRFNESFRLISERLDQVHKGLGEMQTLANGVGDLKKVLTNVKTRGTMGEIQLGAILEQMMSPEQFERNAQVKTGSLERVEFAIRLPGKHLEDRPVLLPIDSKFPIEDYQRLLEAQDSAQEEQLGKQLENAIKKAAKDIYDKYINPPSTTDFAILFVPTEGLYAEVLRRPGLFELLQRDLKITVVGPTNLVAFLSSLQMGFRTLAIERRSSEVWELLGAVKTEFGKFGEVLTRTRKKLEEATNVIDQAQVRTRAIERRLKNVQALPASEAVALVEGGSGIQAETELEVGDQTEID